MNFIKFLAPIAPIAFIALLGCQGSVADGETNPDLGGGDTNPDTNPEPPPTTSARVTTGLVALFDFKEGSGLTVTDKTGSGYDLTIQDPGNIEWISGGGLHILAPTVISRIDPLTPEALASATHINGPCKASSAVTVETWARTDDVGANGPARVVSVSQSANARNVTLAQENTLISGRLRTNGDNTPNNNGTPELYSSTDAWDGQINHIAYTRRLGDASVWLNGLNVNGDLQPLNDQTPTNGDFSNWNDNYPLVLGNEPTLDRPWTGELYLVAIYCRDLNAIEISQNMTARY